LTTINAPVKPTVAPQSLIPFVDTNGILTQVGKQFLQQLYNQTAGANRVIPTVCSNTGNVFSLQIQNSGPTYTNYATHDTFAAVASATSTGTVTAQVVTPSGGLATVPVYKANGATQAGSGDITAGLHYQFTYVDSLNSGNGGLVIR
jgi:hypothetical protein